MAERRVCSVLFADLVGFTPLSETRDPEQVRELLSEYFAAARTVIARYGGTVEKFIGDAVMAVWGTPTATEGDAERAVRAALEVVAAVGELGHRIGATGLAARAGVVTGEVAVTLGATGEGMVAGDAVNTAARVQSAAQPGTVLVDDATQRLAEASVGFDDAGDHVLKGKAEPARLWRAIRVLSGVGGSQRVDGLEAPFVGRDAELRTVKELLHASAERRTPRLVLVSGPAGVGKSRMGWEFRKYVDGLAETIFWHQGRCLSYGEGVAFWALAEIVRQRFGIAEEDAADIAGGKLVQRLPEFVPDEAEQAYVGPRVARLLGVSYPSGTDATLTREELFAGWRLFFERLADVSPVTLLIEDAQHADPSLLDFLDHLVDWARTSPIYVLVFARPELDEHRPGWASGRNRTALTLDPLDERSMDTLVDALVPGMPATAVAAIAAQAQGNPLFAVETVRSLIDRDAVIPVEGVYRLVGDVGELSVPESLHALLAARLDGLDPQLRTLVADAAVLGSSFPAEALVAVSGRDAAAVEAGLAELLRREVFDISADPLSPQRGDYHFSQNLLRQVAYDTLSRRDRKARHLAVAAHLRNTFANEGEEISEVIARHYLDALDAVPDDADAPAIRADAIAALLRAAERAERSGAPARASEVYAEAAELGEQSEHDVLAAAGWWERAAETVGRGADFDAAIAYAGRARAIYAANGETRAVAHADVLAGRSLRRSGRHGEAKQRLDEALAVLRVDPDHDTVRAMTELASLETFRGGAHSHVMASEALTLAQALDVPNAVLLENFITRGIAAEVLNRHAEAVADFEYAARLAERIGESDRWAIAMLNLANALRTSDPAASGVAARAAVDRARQLGNRYDLSAAVSNLAVALLLTGDWDEAERVLGHSAESDGLEPGSVEFAYTAMYRIVLPALRGDRDAMYDSTADIDGARTSEDLQDFSIALVVDAFQAVGRGDARAALDRAQAVLATAEKLGIASESVGWAWPIAVRSAFAINDAATVDQLLAHLDGYPVGHVPPLLRAERSLARAKRRAAAGDPDADDALAAAISELRAVGSPYHLAHGLADRADYLIAQDRVDEADEVRAEVRSIGEWLRAPGLLTRAEPAINAVAGERA
ncbi:MAG: adenylate/guanylate cyclase domain-containing protein [Jatrophihabitans sp.]|uniref:adenylate/guanylate cyclase domain-containing protein n=1 Tax=Jatrophihabitans sp. TaxID=1932789 RepID=UPI003913174D